MTARRQIVVYRPSFAELGGGELQALLIASALSEDHDVVVAGESTPTPEEVQRITGIEPAGLRWHDLLAAGDHSRYDRRWAHVLARHRHARRLSRLGADLAVCVDHARPFRCPAPAGVYSCLFPTVHRSDSGLVRRVYNLACDAEERVLLRRLDESLASWGAFVANSHFTARWMAERWDVRADAVPPPCPPMGPPGVKQPWILNVARFAPPSEEVHDKSHGALIDAFGRLCAVLDQPVELHLAGHADPTDRATADHLRRLAQRAGDLPVHFHVSIDHAALRALYQQASLFWLGTGYGSDPVRQPQRQEHFGIVTVEAMSAGAVPLAHGTGGSVEIIEGRGFGRLWRDLDELVAGSAELLSNPARLARESALAVQAATAYTPERFGERMREIVDRVIAGVHVQAQTLAP